MSYYFAKFTGRIDRRSPMDEGDPTSPILRENWLSRDGKLNTPRGNESVITGLSGIPRWMGRYSTVESSVVSPKTFVYTEDGKLHVLDDAAGTSTIVKELLNQNAYPKHWLYKLGNQNELFFVDGEFLYSHDGNNDNTFLKVDLDDADGNSVAPIDVIEHRDRLFVISNTKLFVSKNLAPKVFDDPLDSIEIVVGSGKGVNLSLGKIENTLYILNTEGIFVLEGDVISALATTFEVRLVEDRNIISGRTAVKVEKAIVFLADDYEIWSWDGNTSQMLSFEFKLKDFVNIYKQNVEKAVAVYHDNYYKMSFVEKGEVEPTLEVWWDAFENKIDIVRGRNVSCYMNTDPTVETEYLQMGQSTVETIVQDDRGSNFNGATIVIRLRTKDLTIEKGMNVRIEAFYPQFSPTGDRNIVINYLLDGRLSNPTDANAYWEQNLRGEGVTLGFITIPNQNQFTGRVKPRIKYSRGESIAFDITISNLDLKSSLAGIGIEYIIKQRSKGVTIGA